MESIERISFFERAYFSLLFAYFYATANVIFLSKFDTGAGDLATLAGITLYCFLFSFLFCSTAIKRSKGFKGYFIGVFLSFASVIMPCILISTYYLLIDQKESALVFLIFVGLATVPPLLISAPLTSLLTKFFYNHLTSKGSG